MLKVLNLQILRAVAALFVVVFHSGLEMERIAAATTQVALFDHARWSLGVPLFFAISGFIMVATCYNSFGRDGSARAFLIRRLTRIAPLYWLLTFLFASLAFIAPKLIAIPASDTMTVLTSFFFWPFARPNGEIRPLVTPGWTLNLEVYFYAIFALGLLFKRHIGLIIITCLITGLCILRLSTDFPPIWLRFWGDPIVLGFIVGIGVGIIYMRGLRLPSWLIWALTVAGFGLSLLKMTEGMVEDALPARLSAILPATLVLLGAVLGKQVDRSRWIYRFLILLGDASYSLYLTHEFILRPLQIVWTSHIGSTLSLWVFVGLGILVSIIVGLLCYFLVELPITRLLKRARAGDR